MGKFLPLAAAGAWLLVVAGVAMAQSFNQGPLPPTGPSSLAITSVSEPPLPASAVGQKIWTRRNDSLGTIVAIQNNGDLILRAGGLKIVPRANYYFTGSGANLRVGSLMTGDDVGALPPYIPPTAAASPGQSPMPNSR
ncbi:MAG TPA: hypothetical protein VFK15_09985 [Burkholderiales bacterium]|jgi:hypothetical protein|nr:hypothetical protein [Burkholderiales bacterium]